MLIKKEKEIDNMSTTRNIWRKIISSIVATSVIMFSGCHNVTEPSFMNIQKTETSATSQAVTSSTFIKEETNTTTSVLTEIKISKNSTLPLTELTTTVETTKTANTPKKITISFLGDCTLASQKGVEQEGNMINYLNTKDTSYFFERCMDIINYDDFTIANCENVFSDNAVDPVYKDYSPAFWFRSSRKNASVFADNSIDAVSIANNHSGDYKEAGYVETKDALEKVGVLWGDIENPIILEKDRISIAIICCKFWSSYYETSIINKIEELSKTTDIQIVFFHGGTEKIHTPEDWKIAGCRKFVDAGADLVIGGHPHVLQPYEEYNGVSIIYSIGNFCYGGHRSPENRTIIYQQTFTLDENNVILESEENIIPFYVYTGPTNNWQPAPIENQEEIDKVLDFLYGRSDSLF